MKLYRKMIAPVVYYPCQSYEPNKKYIEDPVNWYPEEMMEELKEKIKTFECDDWHILGFSVKYVEYAEEPKFKKLKVPEKCGECKSCQAVITDSPYCNMAVVSSDNLQMNISTIYVDPDSKPVWCPIIKMNNELDEMSIEKRSNIDNLITGLTSLFGGEELWE